MDDGCSPTVGILIFAGFVILDFVVFGFIAAMQNLNEAAIERLAGEEDRGARLLRRYTDKNERYTHVCELVVLIVHMLLGFLEVPLWLRVFSAGRCGKRHVGTCGCPHFCDPDSHCAGVWNLHAAESGVPESRKPGHCVWRDRYMWWSFFFTRSYS